MKRRLLVLLLSVVLLALSAGPASAAPAVNRGTFTNSGALVGYTRLMTGMVNTAAPGCLLNTAVKDVLSAARASKVPAVTAARAAVKWANNTGSGFCKGVTALGKMVATAWVTYWATGHVFIQQSVDRTYWFGFYLRTLTVKQWIGPDARHTVAFTATF